MINLTVLEDHLDNMFKALKEASRLLTDNDKNLSLSSRLGDAVSQLNTANHQVYAIHRDGGNVNGLLETLVSCAYKQATAELVELREGRTAKLDVVKPIVNVALLVATSELLVVRAAKTPDLKKEARETAPEDKSGAETPQMREETSDKGYTDHLWTMNPEEFNEAWEKAFYAIRGAYPNNVFGSDTCVPYQLYLDNFRYHFYQWCLSWRFKGVSLFPMIFEKSKLFDSEEEQDLTRMIDELEKGLPSIPRLRQMWVHVVRTNKYQRGNPSAKKLAIHIQALIKYEESFQPDTTYWVGEPSCSANDASFLVVKEARRQADKSVDGIGACIMSQKSGDTWKLTAAAINKKTNKLVKKTFVVKNSSLYEAEITLVNSARLEVENG